MSFEKVLIENNPSASRILLLTEKFLRLHPEFEAYVVGGFVRDTFLQQENKDIDIVVVSKTKTEEKVGLVFAKQLAKYLQVEKVNYFENFGTANFLFEGNEIEIVGARKESYDRGSRKPVVEDGTLEDDLSRRDFTFNAMAFSLNPNSFGELVDKFQGIHDLNKGLIVTPLEPNVTFSDDPLRMLRAVRFASRFGFRIDDKTYIALKDNAKRLEIISEERIVQEMNKILLSPKPSVGLKILQNVGLLKLFLPELSALDEVTERDGKRHKNNFLHTVQVVDQTREVSNDIVVLWSALLHDIGKARTKRFVNGWTFHNHEEVGAKMVATLMQRLKLPINEWGQKITCITKYHGKVKELAIDETADIKISDSAIRRLVVETGEDLDDLLLFAKCDITTKFEDKKLRYWKNYDILKARILEVAELDNLRNFKLPISGDEIMLTFNLKPSKPVGQIKNEIKDAILDGLIPNEEVAAREFMFTIAHKYVQMPV